ncbi:MAG TPA: DUF465 domain-containing protein [Chromatiales bacterium]|nr:DUF465 domain-containing protein [Chromatiales bacterium]
MVDPSDQEAIRQRIAQLRIEHRDLDDAIHAMLERPYVDELQLRRFKKRRLQIKDAITRLENLLIPDLDA